MRFPALVATLAAASLLLHGSTAAQEPEQDTRPGLAVFPFENGGSLGPDREELEPLTVGIQQMLITELGQNAELRLVERSILRELIAEQDLAAEGRVDPRTAAEVGRLVGARYVITGVFADLWGDFRLDSRIVDVETGEILRTEQVRNDRRQLYSMLVEMAGLITAGAALPPLPVEVRDARRSREIPPEAVTLYSRAQVFEDFGQREEAIQLYRQISERFPQMQEAREALLQLQGE